VMAFKIDGDYETLEPGLAYQSFDFLFAAAEMMFVAVFRQEGETSEVAEAVVCDAYHLTGVVVVVMVAWMKRMNGMSGHVAVLRWKN
jgi:hypothetical protein